MAAQSHDLWTLTRARSEIDPDDLAEALMVQVADEPLDYRTCLLIRDSWQALVHHWGDAKANEWMATCPVRVKIVEICRGPFEEDEIGFPSLRRRIVEKTA